MRRKELQGWVTTRSERAGVDMEIGDALPLLHEGRSEAPEVAQDAGYLLLWKGQGRQAHVGRAVQHW
jgi:hypothetical protein